MTKAHQSTPFQNPGGGGTMSVTNRVQRRIVNVNPCVSYWIGVDHFCMTWAKLENNVNICSKKDKTRNPCIQ